MTPAVIVLLDMHASHETITDQIVMTCTCYRHYASAQCSAHMFKLQSPVFDARDLMRSSLSQYAPCADRSLVKRRYCKNVTDERTDDRRQTTDGRTTSKHNIFPDPNPASTPTTVFQHSPAEFRHRGTCTRITQDI